MSVDLGPFLRFAVERHKIWERRQAGQPQPWTDDPVLATRKFTCCFRVLDPGTQFIMTDLFQPGLSDRDQLMRLFLYRHTGRVGSWEYLDVMLGGYPTFDALEDVRAAWKDYRQTGPFFTNAYLVFPQSDTPGTDKLDSIVNLTQRLFTPGGPDDVMPDWTSARTQKERFNVLRRNKGVGDFMAMQVLTDWGYQCGEDWENDFLVPGPGSRKGAKALDPAASVDTTIKNVYAELRALPDCPRLGYRVPSLMDIGSNLLCEYSKYHRYKQQPVPDKLYRPAHPGPQPAPVLPDYYNDNMGDLL